jgi:ferrochelatase
MDKKKNIILCQVGSPRSTAVKDVRVYLREFLSDPRVIDTPRYLWFFILNLFILPFRPKISAQAYKRIEFCGLFPLVELTKGFARELSAKLPDNYHVESRFLLSAPRLNELSSLKDSEDYLILPQFPQFSHTTTSCCFDNLEKIDPNFKKKKNIQVVEQFHTLKGFIDLSVKQIEAHIKKYPIEDLVISFHGIPVRYVLEKNDPYYLHCCETFTLIKEKVNFPKDKIHMSFQSRLGSEEWLNPYTDQFTVKLTKQGSKSIGVYCPSFVVDCLETTDEIGNELAHDIEAEGGELVFIPCLNNSQDWVNSYAEFIQTFCEKDDSKLKDLFYKPVPSDVSQNMPELKTNSNPLSPKAKKTIKLVFLTLFLDLIGFSIIFPMFPALAKHYLTVDPDNYFLQLIFGSIVSLTEVGGTSMSSIVLFGGALGALYSILQFFAAPIWGGLSDKFGRKPILIVSIFGLFASYVMWIFAGSFTVLIMARIIGGIMGGNLSTATAAVADVTDKSNRSKGMAFVGIAFALGFIFGPALGGVLTAVNPLDHFPGLASWGVNPFSYPALLAAILSLVNLVFIFMKFEETLSPENKHESKRTINVFKLLAPLPYKNVNLTNYSYFLFISAFSGMEFTLTFLAVERLAYTSMDNAYMFIFIGFIIAFVQGGYVRRKAHLVGEKKLALAGLITVIPGLLIIAYTTSGFGLYLGLAFLAVGSALAIPTLTSLVSLFTPSNEQGRSIGIFRSLGSLGRVIGPVLASLIYWRVGSVYPYVIGAVFIIIPILILVQVKQESNDNDSVEP